MGALCQREEGGRKEKEVTDAEKGKSLKVWALELNKMGSNIFNFSLFDLWI